MKGGCTVVGVDVSEHVENELVEIGKFKIFLEIATLDSLENEVWDFQVEEFGELMQRDESRFEGVKLGLEQLS